MDTTEAALRHALGVVKACTAGDVVAVTAALEAVVAANVADSDALRRFLSCVLERVYPLVVPLMPAAAVDATYGRLFDVDVAAWGAVPLVVVLVDGLREQPAEATRLLGCLVASAAFAALPGSAVSGGDGPQWHALLQAWVSVPERVANAAHGRREVVVPSCLHPKPYFKQVASAAVASWVATPSTTMASAVSRLTQRGHARSVARAWCLHAASSPSHTFSAFIETCVPPDRMAAFLIALLAYGRRDVWPGGDTAAVATGMTRLCGDVGDWPPYAAIVLRRRLFLRHKLDPVTAAGLVAWCVRDVDAEHIASVWSQDAFLGDTDEPLQASVTSVVLACVRLAPDAALTGDSRLLMALLGGVQARLGCSNSSLRQHGMRVAEAFSRRITPDAPLEFDEPAPSPQALPPPEAKASEPEAPPPAQRRRPPPRRLVPLDPHRVAPPRFFDTDSDSAVSSDYDDGDDAAGVDAASVSDDSLEPYDLLSESDDSTAEGGDVYRKAAPAPAFVRDAISAVRDKEDYRRASAALSGLPDLVRRTHAAEHTRHQVSDTAVPLLRALLYLEDRFSMPEFPAHRRAAIVAVLVCEPVRGAGFVVREVFSKENSDGTRHEALGFIGDAARELAGVVVSGGGGVEAPAHPTVADAGEGGGKTRRWASPRRPAPKTAPNRFAGLLAAFFNPLINGLQRHMARVAASPLVLADVVRLLGLLLECGRLSPDAPRLCRRLLELVWALRFHDNLAVRRAALVALAAVMAAVGRLNLLTDASVQGGAARTLHDDLTEAGQWLATVRSHDPDPECRALASKLAGVEVLRG